MNSTTKNRTTMKGTWVRRCLATIVVAMTPVLIAPALFAQTPADTNYFLWAESPPSFSSSAPSAAMYGVAADGEGNVYAVGGVKDGSPLVDVPLIAFARSGESDRTGRELWRLETTRGTMVGRSVVFGRDKTLYIAGECSGDVCLRIQNWGVRLTNPPVTTASNRYCFVLKISLEDQRIAWMRRLPSTIDARASGLALRGDSTLYVAGTFKGQLTIDNGNDYTSTGYSAFVIRMDAGTGTTMWSAQAECDSANVVEIMPVENGCLLLADFRGHIQFSNAGNAAPIIPVENSHGGSDIVVARYTDNGIVQASRTIGGAGNEVAGGAVLGKAGEIYICGSFDSPLTVPTIAAIDPIGVPVPGLQILVPTADRYNVQLLSEDAFVGRYRFGLGDPEQGGFEWIATIGGGGADRSRGVARSGDNIYVTGSFWDHADFKTGKSGIPGYLRPSHSYGHLDMFVAQYSLDGVVRNVKAGAYVDDDWGLALAIVGDSVNNDDRDTAVVVGACAQAAEFNGRSGGTGISTRYFASLLPIQHDLDILPDTIPVRGSIPCAHLVNVNVINRSPETVRNIAVHIDVLYDGDVRCKWDTVFYKNTRSGETENVLYNVPDDVLRKFRHPATATVVSTYRDSKSGFIDRTLISIGPFGGLQVIGRTHDALRYNRLERSLGLESNDGEEAVGEVRGEMTNGFVLDMGMRRFASLDGAEFRVEAQAGSDCDMPEQVSIASAVVRRDTVVLGWRFPRRNSAAAKVEIYRRGGYIDTISVPAEELKLLGVRDNGSVRMLVGKWIMWKSDKPFTLLVRNRPIPVDSIVIGLNNSITYPEDISRCIVVARRGCTVSCRNVGIVKSEVLEHVRGDALLSASLNALDVDANPDAKRFGCAISGRLIASLTLKLEYDVIPSQGEIRIASRASALVAGEFSTDTLVLRRRGDVMEVALARVTRQENPVSNPRGIASLIGEATETVVGRFSSIPRLMQVVVSDQGDSIEYNLTLSPVSRYWPAGSSAPIWKSALAVRVPAGSEKMCGLNLISIERTLGDLMRLIVPSVQGVDWSECGKVGIPLIATAEPAPVSEFRLRLAPNPAVDHVEITCRVPWTGHVRIGVYDQTGRLLRSVVDEIKTAGDLSASFSTVELLPGPYFVRIETDAGIAVAPFVIIR